MIRHRSSAGFTLIELLVVIAIIGILLALLLSAVQVIRESARRNHCKNNVRQISIAAIAYQSAQREFPPGFTFEHNWAAHLLEFLELKTVAQKYSWDVLWNDPANQAAVSTVVPTFMCPTNPSGFELDEFAPDNTTGVCDYTVVPYVVSEIYLAGYASEPKSNIGALGFGEPTRIAQITDGTSHTFLFLECVGRPVYYLRTGKGPTDHDDGGNIPVVDGRVEGAGWANPNNVIPLHGVSNDGLTSPGPMPVNRTNNNEPFGFHPGLIVASRCDGSVSSVSESITMQQFTELVTRAGGEVSSFDQ